MANLVYSPKDILQKEFKTKMMNGYDPIEVFGKKLDETPSTPSTPVTPSAPSMTAEPANHDVDNAQTRQF